MEAVKWWTNSAEQGKEDAKKELEKLKYKLLSSCFSKRWNNHFTQPACYRQAEGGRVSW
jgi:hypothetical protein